MAVKKYKERRTQRRKNYSSSSSDDDSSSDNDDHRTSNNIRPRTRSNSESSESSNSNHSNHSTHSNQRSRRSSIAQAAQASSLRRAGFSSRGMKSLVTKEQNKSKKPCLSSKETKSSNESKSTLPPSSPTNRTRERPDDYRIEARLGSLRSKSSRDVLSKRHSSTSTDNGYSNHSRRTSSDAYVGDNEEEDWFLERHQQRKNATRRDRMKGSSRQARKSITKYEGHELLQTDDPLHIDTIEFSSMVSLLRYNRGYPIQSNYTRFEFPKGIFLSNKYSRQAAILLASILIKSTKVLKRLGFTTCFFEAQDIVVLMDACSKNDNIALTHLILDGNSIGEQGVESIVHYLEYNTTLNVLKLRDTNLTDESILLLIDAIIECGTDLPLEQLDVRGRQRFDSDIVIEMVEDMRSAGNMCEVLMDQPKKEDRSYDREKNRTRGRRKRNNRRRNSSSSDDSSNDY